MDVPAGAEQIAQAAIGIGHSRSAIGERQRDQRPLPAHVDQIPSRRRIAQQCIDMVVAAPGSPQPSTQISANGRHRTPFSSAGVQGLTLIVLGK